MSTEKKYELIKEPGSRFFRIKALRDFNDIKKGDFGGLIEKEDNLSHEGNCWITNKAVVSENAIIYGNAQVYGNAIIYGNAQVYDDAQVYGDAQVSGNAHVNDSATIYGNAQVYGDAQVFGNVQKTEDYLVIGPIGSRRSYLTCVNGTHYATDCFNGTKEELENMLLEYTECAADQRDVQRKIYLEAIAATQAIFKLRGI